MSYNSTIYNKSITATTNAIKLITNAIKIDRSLKGRAFKPFKGEYI
jgi:hypothetical protein